MKKIRFVLVILIFFIILLLSERVQAKDYSIESIDMQVEIQKNGDLKIDQTLQYNFNGSYNGIYITIPYGVNDTKYDEIRKQTSLVNDSFYNASEVQINKVSVTGNMFKLTDYAINGQNQVYTVAEENNIRKIKIYSPTTNSSKTFFISYTLKDVAVKHNDIGEIYYNFIGGAWDKDIKRLNIDIKLPNNTSKENLYAFAHGPENGVVTIENANQINLYVENVKSGEYVAGRVLCNLDNISKSLKKSDKMGLRAIMQEEENIYNKIAEKDRFNTKLLILASVLLIYWLVLILIYEKDKKYIISSNEDELFGKYNPLIAGCIQGSRNVLSRDILAVVMELINKEYLELEIVPNISNTDNIISKVFKNNEKYIYYIKENAKSNYKPDKIEYYIVRWLFRGRKKYHINEKIYINLLEALKELPKDKIANEKFKELDIKVMEELNRIGANKSKVPISIRVLNTIIFILTMVLSIYHFITTLSNTSLDQTSIIFMILIYSIALFPFIIYILIIPILLLNLAKKAINKIVQKVNGQKIVLTSISIILIFMVIMILTAIYIKNKYLLACEFLICVGTLIMLTDNLMLKNDPVIIEDYSRLNSLKNKIENYSIMKDKDINEIILWEKYLSYAISFGIADLIVDRVKIIGNDDDNLIRMLNSNTLSDYITNDYSYFNMKMESETVNKMIDTANKISSSGGGFSGGSGGGVSGGGGFSGGGGRGRRRRSLLKTSCKTKRYGKIKLKLSRKSRHKKDVSKTLIQFYTELGFYILEHMMV